MGKQGKSEDPELPMRVTAYGNALGPGPQLTLCALPPPSHAWGVGMQNVALPGFSGQCSSSSSPTISEADSLQSSALAVPTVSPGSSPPPPVSSILGLLPPSAFTFDPVTTNLITPDGFSFNPFCSMEIVWHGEFDRLFVQYYPHQWYLVPTMAPPRERMRIFKDSAKVRFSCTNCGHGWTSMKGRVIFWFQLNHTNNSGCVMFKLFGQCCKRCQNGKFEHAMWYPEEVVKVIGNVYNRIGQVYYGFYRPPLRVDRRLGKPRNQHNSELCQACKDGLCKEEWTFT